MGARVYAKKEEAYDTKQDNMYNGFKEVIHLSGFYFVLISFLKHTFHRYFVMAYISKI